MDEQNSSFSSSSPSNLNASLEAQINAILTMVNMQIQGLQYSLCKAWMELASQIASKVQPEPYIFRKTGNEQQFNFNQKVIKTSAWRQALDSGNIGTAKEELNTGISFLNDRQKIIKLTDKSLFGWATVQENAYDDLAGVSKIKRLTKKLQLSLKLLKIKIQI